MVTLQDNIPFCHHNCQCNWYRAGATMAGVDQLYISYLWENVLFEHDAHQYLFNFYLIYVHLINHVILMNITIEFSTAK